MPLRDSVRLILFFWSAAATRRLVLSVGMDTGAGAGKRSTERHARIDDDTVLAIRAALKQGKSFKIVARMFDVDKEEAEEICRCRSKRHRALLSSAQPEEAGGSAQKKGTRLTDEQIWQIDRELRSGTLVKKVAWKFGRSEGHIRDIGCRRFPRYVNLLGPTASPSIDKSQHSGRAADAGSDSRHAIVLSDDERM